jgi:hypothetical protein
MSGKRSMQQCWSSQQTLPTAWPAWLAVTPPLQPNASCRRCILPAECSPSHQRCHGHPAVSMRDAHASQQSCRNATDAQEAARQDARPCCMPTTTAKRAPQGAHLQLQTRMTASEETCTACCMARQPRAHNACTCAISHPGIPNKEQWARTARATHRPPSPNGWWARPTALHNQGAAR